MRRTKTIAAKILLLTLMVGVSLILSQSSHAESIATVSQVQGEVFVQPVGSDPKTWTPITQDTPINNGDSVKTVNGTCALVYTDKATIDLWANTTITAKEQSDTQDISIILGKLKASVNKEKVDKTFQFITPTAVAAVRGTVVEIGFNEQGQLSVKLENGTVEVFNDESEMNITLSEGNSITVQYDAATGQIMVQNDPGSTGSVTVVVSGQELVIKPGESASATVPGPGTEATTETPDPGTPAGGGDDTGNQSETVPGEGGDDTGTPPPPSSPI